MIVLKWLFFIAVGAVAEHFVFPLVNVCGNSMFPTYHDGEIILSRSKGHIITKFVLQPCVPITRDDMGTEIKE